MQVKDIDIFTGKIKGYGICKKKYQISFLGGPTTPTYSIYINKFKGVTNISNIRNACQTIKGRGRAPPKNRQIIHFLWNFFRFWIFSIVSRVTKGPKKINLKIPKLNENVRLLST